MIRERAATIVVGVAVATATLLEARAGRADDASVGVSAPATPPTSASSGASGRGVFALHDDQHFQVDPVADITFITVALGFAGVSQLIISTGEIRPQRPIDPNQLLAIDRGAVTQTFDSNAATYSNVGLYAAVGFAVLDPVLSGLRDGRDAGVVDAVLYAESLSLTFALTDLAKIAVRRPRPSAYVAQAQLDKQFGPNAPAISDTDQSLSFFSGHAAILATTTATATYLAFSRSPRSWRPWVTLALGTLLTAGVSFERVRAGAHFPTDVVAGALTGGAVGILVPHLHRHEGDGRTMWIGLAPMPSGMGVGAHGSF